MAVLLTNYFLFFRNSLFSLQNVLFYDRGTDNGTEMLLQSSQSEKTLRWRTTHENRPWNQRNDTQ